MSIQTTILGEIDYYGETYTAIREIHDDEWKLVFVNEEERIVMLTY